MKDGPEKQVDHCEFKAGLVYRMSYGIVGAIEKTCLKTKNQPNNQTNKKAKERKEGGRGVIRGVRVPKQGLLRV